MRQAGRLHNTFDASRFVTRELLLPDALYDPCTPDYGYLLSPRSSRRMSAIWSVDGKIARTRNGNNGSRTAIASFIQSSGMVHRSEWVVPANFCHWRAPWKGGAFPVGESPTRQPLQPEATGATVEVTKWLKPPVKRVTNG